MIEQSSIEHHIQKHIMGVLIHRKVARFRDLRPPKTDTNLFSYHLKTMLKSGFIAKQDGGYTLSHYGLAYADRVSIKKLNIRTQPKIITMTALFDSNGQVLLQKRSKQPYIDTWTLPYGKLHIDDATIEAAALREVKEKLDIEPASLNHVGDCYIRVVADGSTLSSTLAHVFTTRYDLVALPDDARWVNVEMFDSLDLAPAVDKIVRVIQQSPARFFLELSENWIDE